LYASSARRADIERVLRSLHVLPAQVDRIHALADGLETLAAAGPQPAPPHLRPGSTRTVVKQLNDLRRLSSSLADKLERGGSFTRACEQLCLLLRTLTGDTRQSIDKSAQTSTLNLAFIFNDLPKRLLDAGSMDMGALVLPLRQLAEIAGSASAAAPKGTPSGRPPDHYTMAVARLAARQYQILTGNEPNFWQGNRAGQDKVRGPFFDFARDLFAVMGIRHDALTYVSRAAFDLRGRGRKK
jgi:hypothetical protein